MLVLQHIGARFEHKRAQFLLKGFSQVADIKRLAYITSLFLIEIMK